MSDSTKHTPGPWRYSDAGMQVFANQDQMLVADTRGWGYLTGGPENLPASDAAKVMDSNGRLIAAAPDLLEALEQCLLDIEGDEYSHNRNFAAGNVARDAIEKATGERPKDVVG